MNSDDKDKDAESNASASLSFLPIYLIVDSVLNISPVLREWDSTSRGRRVVRL